MIDTLKFGKILIIISIVLDIFISVYQFYIGNTSAGAGFLIASINALIALIYITKLLEEYESD